MRPALDREVGVLGLIRQSKPAYLFFLFPGIPIRVWVSAQNDKAFKGVKPDLTFPSRALYGYYEIGFCCGRLR